MRYIGLDVGRDFAHAAVVDGKGSSRRLGRMRMGDEFRAYAATLGPDDVVALESVDQHLGTRRAARSVRGQGRRLEPAADPRHRRC